MESQITVWVQYLHKNKPLGGTYAKNLFVVKKQQITKYK